MRSAYAFAVVLNVVTLALRDVYEVLKRKGAVDPESTRVFATVFTSMIVMWVSWFAVGVLALARVESPPAVRWAGLGLVLVGAALAVGGMWQLKGVENIDHLVTTGLFSRIRHPMYVGFVLWIVGWCAFTGAVTSLVLAPFGLASILGWRHLEEAGLALRYGAKYAEYKASTWV